MRPFVSLPFSALLLLSAAFPRQSSADCISPDRVASGFLGYDRAAPSADETIEVPRNIAVLATGIVDETSDPGTEVTLVETSIERIRRPETPLPPGTLVRAGAQWAVTNNVIDTEVPGPLELLSARAGATGSCSGDLVVSIAGRPSDDHTSRENLVYVVYAGSTSTEAMEGSDRRSVVYGPTLVPNHGETWMSMAVVDQSGNESPRSNAVEVTYPSSGCHANIPMSSAASPWLVLGLIWFFIVFTRSRLRTPP